MASSRRTRPELKPLDVSCDRSNCEEGLHCFRESQKLANLHGKHESGSCQVCGATLIDWERVKKRDSGDVTHTFAALKNEWIRHRYWHLDIDQHAKNHATRKGRAGIRAALDKRIRSSVGVKHSRDGSQTPWDGNIIYYAQHATACCCRRCIQYWHGIAETETLSEDNIAYFKDLCLRYILERMPDLAEAGRYVPPIRRRNRRTVENGEGDE